MSTENGDIPNMLSESRGQHPFPEMSAFGYLIGVLLVPVLLPLVPFVLVYLVVDWLRGQVTG